jgi:hypothetical protein
VAGLLARESDERKAALFLLDPNTPGSKEARFRETIRPELGWFVDYMMGEDLLRRGQRQQALDAYTRSYRALEQIPPSAQSNTERILGNHLKARLYELRSEPSGISGEPSSGKR